MTKARSASLMAIAVILLLVCAETAHSAVVTVNWTSKKQMKASFPKSSGRSFSASKSQLKVRRIQMPIQLDDHIQIHRSSYHYLDRRKQRVDADIPATGHLQWREYSCFPLFCLLWTMANRDQKRSPSEIPNPFALHFLSECGREGNRWKRFSPFDVLCLLFKVTMEFEGLGMGG